MNYLDYLNAFNVFLIWLSIVSLSLFIYVAHQLKHVNKKLGKLTDEENKKWQEQEVKAQNDYSEIIQAANKKASEITLRASEVNTEGNQKLQQTINEMLANQKAALDEASASVLATHRQQVAELNQHILEVSGNIYKDIDTKSRADMQNFFELIKKQTFEAEKFAEERIKQEYEKLEKEMEIRREEKIKKLDENIYKILSNISKDIIGKSLDMTSQHELILKSLEQAKKEGAIK